MLVSQKQTYSPPQIFALEEQTLRPVVTAKHLTLASVGAMAVIGTFAPVVFNMPKPIATAMHLLGLGNAIALSAMTYKSPTQEKILKAIEDTHLDQFKSGMQHRVAFNEVLTQQSNELEVLAALLKLPDPYRTIKLIENGFGYMVQQPAIDVAANQLRSADIASPQFEQKTAEPIIFDDGTIEFPEEDLAMVLAEITTHPAKASSTLIACPSGSGKSNLLRAALTAIHTVHNGNFDPYIFAGKDGETYCGLEKTNKYIYSGGTEYANETQNRIQAIAEKRCRHFVGFPTICIWDEYNNTLGAAKMYDKLNKGSQVSTLISGANYSVVTKGRSKICLNIMTSHSPQVKDIEMNTDIQQSLNIVILGRGKYGAIKNVLSNKRAIIEDDDTRENLYEQFKAFYAKGDRDRVLALTNLNGDWRLVFLPRYPDEQPELGTNTVKADDVQVQEEVSDRTVAESKPKAEPKIANDPYKAFLDWLDDCKENGRVPTIEAGKQVLMQNGFENVQDAAVEYIIKNPERFRK